MDVWKVSINDNVEILGHLFFGLKDIFEHVEMSLYREYSPGKVSPEEPEKQCEVHVGLLYSRFPCFDSDDYATENRYYQNYILRNRPITEEDMRLLSELPQSMNECRITDSVPSSMLPLVYYYGDGGTMLITSEE